MSRTLKRRCLISMSVVSVLLIQAVLITRLSVLNFQCRKNPFRKRILNEFPVTKKYKSEKAKTQKVKANAEVIHLATGCYGVRQIGRLTTMLKSVLFYRTNPMKLHILTDEETKIPLETYFSTWNISYFTVTCYPIKDRLTEEISWIPYTHQHGNYGLHKLLLDHILPENVEKIIVYDTDVVVLSDISELWRYFDRFIRMQAIGMAEESQLWYQKNDIEIWPAVGSGYNGGLILYDLKKLRSLNWTLLWKNETKLVLAVKKQAYLAEQDILNNFIKNNPDFFFILPCNWNVQFDKRTMVGSCYKKYKSKIKGLHTTPKKLNVTPTGTVQFVELYRRAVTSFMSMDGSRFSGSRYSHSYRIIPYFMGCDNITGDITRDITLVLLVEFREISELASVMKIWSGPMSIVIVGTDGQLPEVYELLQREGRKNIVYHYVYIKKNEQDISTNFLNDIALNFSRTTHFIISHTSFSLPAETYEKLRFLFSDNSLLAIPTFKTNKVLMKIASKKQDLLTSIEQGIIEPYDQLCKAVVTQWLRSNSVFSKIWTSAIDYHVLMPKEFYREIVEQHNQTNITILPHLYAVKYEYPMPVE